MDLELRGKKVLITGASKGIGLACAHEFAAEGARVHIASRSEAGLKAAADTIARQHKAEVSIHPFDFGNTQNVVALATACGDVDSQYFDRLVMSLARDKSGLVRRTSPLDFRLTALRDVRHAY